MSQRLKDLTIEYVPERDGALMSGTSADGSGCVFFCSREILSRMALNVSAIFNVRLEDLEAAAEPYRTVILSGAVSRDAALIIEIHIIQSHGTYAIEFRSDPLASGSFIILMSGSALAQFLIVIFRLFIDAGWPKDVWPAGKNERYAGPWH